MEKLPLTKAIQQELPEPTTPQMTLEHALIMLTYMVEREFGEVTIPWSYLAEKHAGTSPAELEIHSTDAGVVMKVKSDNVRSRIIL